LMTSRNGPIVSITVICGESLILSLNVSHIP
jgi:hypothetical protein